MDDIVNSVPSWMFTAIIAVCILLDRKSTRLNSSH